MNKNLKNRKCKTSNLYNKRYKHAYNQTEKQTYKKRNKQAHKQKDSVTKGKSTKRFMR